jgi:microcystin degradation protein MlrC
MKLAVARFWYEGNAFCLLPAQRADFERREWHKGPAALQAAQGTATELAAVAQWAHAHVDWRVQVSRCTSALPAGPIDDRFFDAFMAEVLADLAGEPWDAIYLSLHGAAITHSRDTPELDFVRALRRGHPQAVIGASFDLHANHDPRWVDLLDIACGYRTYPHVDMVETAARTLALMERALGRGVRPIGVLRNDGIILSSANMRTDAGPMAELQALACARIAPPILDISVYGGFAYANTPNIGASVMVWADRADPTARATAQQVAEQLTEAVRGRAPDFDIPLIAPSQAIALALQSPGLVAVTDAADNPLSGGIGDTPALLRALVDARPDGECVFASLADAAIVARAHAAGPGAAMAVSLGAQRTGDHGPAVEMQVQVERLTDGRFVNTGPMEHGGAVQCGRTAVLRAQRLRIIVTEHVSACNDPAFFALHGVDLSAVRLLCVKAKNHFRAAFAPLCSTIVDADAPGPASLDLASLPLRRRAA